MMTEKIEDPAADIAWMRRLAEEGAQVPMQGASILFAAGLLYGGASLGHWAVASGLAGLDIEAVNYLWLGATVSFVAVLALVAGVGVLVRKPKPDSAGMREVPRPPPSLGAGPYAQSGFNGGGNPPRRTR